MLWNKKPGWFGKQLDSNVKALNDGDTGRVPWIFCVLSEEHAPSKLAASRALNSALKLLRFDDIIRIDAQMRQTTSMEWNIDWRRFRIDSFFTSAMNADERRAVIIFASFNPNGYVREQAVYMMKEYDRTLPYIILRQNDWVVQVRQAAAKVFDKRLQNLAAGEIIAALPFMEKLKWSSRGSHGEYTQKFFDRLISSEHREDLLAGLRSNNIRTRRICIYAILDTAQPDINQALLQLKREPDPFLRKVIFEKLCQLDQKMIEASHVLLHDRYPANRALALQYLYDTNKSEILGIAKAMLLDKNDIVRSLARKIVQEFSAAFDFRTLYEKHLEQNTVVSILGIGEIGKAVDTEKINGYLCDSRIAVIRATMVSLMRLDSEKYYSCIVEMLGDSRAGVVKTALLLTRKYHNENYDQIRDIFLRTQFEHSKIKCASFLFSAPKWESLLYMLEALSCDMESVQELTMQAIRKWLARFNRSFTQATARQKEAIHELISIHNAKIPAHIERELLFVLK